jgi:Protein of unknown function (DUF3574)
MAKDSHFSAIAFLMVHLFLQTGCVTTTSKPVCIRGEINAINDLLYFGTTKPKGVVSPEDWQSFLNNSVSPRFSSGFTSWSAQGQWQGDKGTIIHEATLLLNLIHPDDSASETAVNAIINEYGIRFDQEAILRVRSPVCTHLIKPY